MDDKKRSLLSQLFGDEPKKVPKERKPSKRSQKRDEERPVREPKVAKERQPMKVRSRGVQTMTKLVDF